tara:strand:+ start:7686 stop:8603 length:918 start_codon:yes stop_codon:yes gene_type:complete
MTTINDRIGSQNVIRVLSNASAPPTRLANLSDVNSTRKTEDGLVLVWDLTSEKFVLTDVIDSPNLILTGITSFSNATNSSNSLEGAVKISGGAGIAKNLNVGGDFKVTGLSTFSNNARFSGASVTVDNNLLSKDLFASNQIIGVGTGILGSLKIFEGASQVEVISSTRELKNIVSLDAVTTSTIETAIANAPNTFTDLNITGISTFVGIATFASGILVSGISTFTSLVNATNGLVASTAKISDLTAGRIVYVGSQGELQDNQNLIFNGSLLSLAGSINITGISTFGSDLNVTGTLTAGLIDGGSY